MPEDPLGRDLQNALDQKILYEKVDSEVQGNALRGMLTLKLDFTSEDDFNNFIGAQRGWRGTDREQDWIGRQIYQKDPKLNKNRPLTVEYIRYKHSIFDAAPVYLVLVKYMQDLEQKVFE